MHIYIYIHIYTHTLTVAAPLHRHFFSGPGAAYGSPAPELCKCGNSRGCYDLFYHALFGTKFLYKKFRYKILGTKFLCKNVMYKNYRNFFSTSWEQNFCTDETEYSEYQKFAWIVIQVWSNILKAGNTFLAIL